MYLNLHERLDLKDEDLTKYDTLLVGFDEKMMMLVGQIKLRVVIEGKEVMVNFIVLMSWLRSASCPTRIGIFG